MIDEVIEFGKNYQYVDDRQFSQQWIESRIRVKKLGRRRLFAELSQKGIDSQLINECLDQILEEAQVDEAENAYQCLEDNAYRFDSDDRFKNRNRAFRFLAYRGYTPDVIQKVMNRYFQ